MLRSRSFLYLGLVATLAACGGGSSDGPRTGSLSVGITDAPVDDVYDLAISITGITVKPQNGDQISFTFDPAREIHLLDLTDGVTEMLLVNEPIPAGAYNWIRFDVDETNSYVMPDEGGMLPLRIPSDKLRFVSGLTITVNRLTSFVVDWDVRKGLTDPVGQEGYLLRPAFRVTDTNEYATIAGTVADRLVEDDLETDGCSPYDPEALEGSVVYLYNLMPLEGDFDDIFMSDTIEEGPIATTQVNWDGDMTFYQYRIDYVSPGDYTLAYTCQGLSDTPDGQEDIEFRSFVDVTIVSPEPQDVLDADFP